MFDYDRTKHQAVISIVSSPLGIWAAETQTRLNRSVRTAGRVPTEYGTTHDLLAIALNSALRAISAPQESRLCEIAGVEKLSIVVTCRHRNFLSQLKEYFKNPTMSYLKVKNSRILHNLTILNERYELTLQITNEDRNHALLRDWADKHVIGGKQFTDYPLERPTVISEIEDKPWTLPSRKPLTSRLAVSH